MYCERKYTRGPITGLSYLALSTVYFEGNPHMSTWQRERESQGFIPSMTVAVGMCIVASVGCSTMWGQQPGPPNPPLKIVVGPILLEAAITKSTQIYSFNEAPAPELEPIILAQLRDEIQATAQQSLTENLTRQPGFEVVPFDETRRFMPDIAPVGTSWNDMQLRVLGRQTNADFVISGRILDYGVVRWQYWTTGLVLHSAAGLTALGFATAWNPIAIGGYFLYELPDVAIWYGGASVFGWVFRPVRIEVEFIQLKPCEGLVLTEQEAVVRVLGKDLAEYSADDQKKKEIQLEINLKRAMANMADIAGGKLRHQPCTDNGSPSKLSSFSLWAVLDFLY
jgi:hypothetical protein